MTYLGVDGCSGGWFAAIVDEDTLHTELYATIDELWDAHDDIERLLVDVPIGLLEDSRRPCDVAGKERLGCRGNSVFYTPCREVVSLASEDREVAHAEASDAERSGTGNGLSQQAWNITDKIAEVDAFLDEVDTEVLHESHPELCFYGFTDGRPIAYSKRTTRGRAIRLSVLAEELSGVDACYQKALENHLRGDVKRDDIVDALVLAAAARSDELVSVPDAEGARTEGDGGKEMRIHHPPSRWEREGEPDPV